MNHAKLVPATLLAGAVLALGACASDKTHAPYQPNPDALTKTTYPQVTTTGDLAQWLLVDQPVVSRDGILKVSVPVRLNSSTGQWSKVQYRFIFLDANAVPVRAQPDWMPVTLEPLQQVFMQANSLDTNAADWRLEIRPQR